MIKKHLLSRPGKYNSLTIEMLDELIMLVEAKDMARAIIIYGDENHFSSGANLKGDFFEIFKRIAHLYQAVQQTDKIMIAAIDGYCIAGGFGLAAACDLAIATPEAVFQLPETRRGLLAPLASLIGNHMLPRRVLMELVLAGDPLPAERLYQVGFLNKLVHRDELVLEAEKLAEAVLKGAPKATAMTKKMLASSSFTIEQALKWQDDALKTGEPEEGFKAFKEKRNPKW